MKNADLRACPLPFKVGVQPIVPSKCTLRLAHLAPSGSEIVKPLTEIPLYPPVEREAANSGLGELRIVPSTNEITIVPSPESL